MINGRMIIIGILIVVCHRTALGMSEDEVVEELQRLTLKQVAARVERCVPEQQIVTQLTMKTVRRSIRYDLVIAPNPDQLNWLIRLNQSKTAFEKTNRDYAAAGYEVAVSDSVRLGQQRYYSGVWVRPLQTPIPLILPNLPIPVSGEPVEQLSAVDTLMAGFLKEHNVVGATVAIAFQGKQVYSRGFGWADIENQIPMSPNAVMRIANVSKPITALAIMQLVEQGRLDLDERVMPLLKKSGFKRPADERWNQITIRQLLQHTGGWDRGKSQDPMFQTGQAHQSLKLKRSTRPRDMVAWQMQQSLDFDPGSREVYCNFGYCVLGRIVEAVSGQTYDEYLAEYVLSPADMSTTRLAKTRLEDRGVDEVRYYMQNQKRVPAVWSAFPNRHGRLQPQEVETPYGGWDIEVMDAYAGLLSSAPDLVRFASAVFDGDSSLLKPETRIRMLERPSHANSSNGYWYGCGWNVRRAGAGDYDV